MDDLQATRLCAEAMGYHTEIASDGTLHTWSNWTGGWNPLRGDAQAMALVKQLGLELRHNAAGSWWVMGNGASEESADLNRAIVYCVAAMQAKRSPAPAAASRGRP